MPPNAPPLRHAPASGDGMEASEREFAAFAQDQDPLDIEAATWVTRKRSGLDARGKADLQAWLDADARHAEAFADMDATFGDLQQLPDDDVAQLKADLRGSGPVWAEHAGPVRRPATAESPPPLHPPEQAARQRWFGGLIGLVVGAARSPASRSVRPRAPQAAAMALAVAGLAWLGWDHWHGQPVFEQAYATLRGQQLSVTLPDAPAQATSTGSTLRLDTATRADVRLYRDRREVRLQDGQALFAVHSDPHRPFHVYAGALRITVVGTRFSVRHTRTGLAAGQTVVEVEEGRVRVAGAEGGPSSARDGSAGPPAAWSELTAGQTVVADAQGHLGPVTRVPTDAIAPWRTGRLSFDQTPLAQAIAEFERYGRTDLVVRDPAVAALPVGGSYSLTQWQRFAQTLPEVLPVHLMRRGEVTEVVAR